DRLGLGVAALELCDAGADAVAGEPAGYEHDQLAVAGDAAAAVRQPVDPELDLLTTRDRSHALTSLWSPVPLPVNTYRDRLEEMTAAVMEEHYLHAAGRQPTYEIAH